MLAGIGGESSIVVLCNISAGGGAMHLPENVCSMFDDVSLRWTFFCNNFDAKSDAGTLLLEYYEKMKWVLKSIDTYIVSRDDRASILFMTMSGKGMMNQKFLVEPRNGEKRPEYEDRILAAAWEVNEYALRQAIAARIHEHGILFSVIDAENEPIVDADDFWKRNVEMILGKKLRMDEGEDLSDELIRGVDLASKYYPRETQNSDGMWGALQGGSPPFSAIPLVADTVEVEEDLSTEELTSREFLFRQVTECIIA